MDMARNPNITPERRKKSPLEPETPVVDVCDLRIEIGNSGYDIIDEVELTIASGEVLALVGESGSGKTTLGLAILGYTRRGASIVEDVVVALIFLLAICPHRTAITEVKSSGWAVAWTSVRAEVPPRRHRPLGVAHLREPGLGGSGQ